MNRCKKFYYCNAPICPLDAEWQLRVSGGDECEYLRFIKPVRLAKKIAPILLSFRRKGSNYTRYKKKIQELI